MTIMGTLWLLVVAYCFSKKNIKYMLYITLLFMTFQSCNVLILGGKGIGPGVLTSIAFVLKIIVSNRFVLLRPKYAKMVFTSGLFLMVAVVASVIYNGVFLSVGLVLLQLLVYFVVFLSIYWSKQSISEEMLYEIVRSITVFHCVFAIIQLVTTMNLIPLRPILKLLFFNDSSTNVVFNKVYYARMMSTLMEPSYFASYLVGAFYFLLVHKKKWKSNMLLFVLIFVEILLTKSSTAYGAFLLVGIIFIVLSEEMTIKQKITLIAVSVVVFIVLYLGSYNLLDDVVFSKSESSSFRERTRFNTQALEAFKKSKITGIGYKQCRGSSIIVSLLGQIGIVGFCAYCLFNLCILFNRNYSNVSIRSASKFAVLTAVITQIIACPDLDLCTYWIWLYVFAVTTKSILIEDRGAI